MASQTLARTRRKLNTLAIRARHRLGLATLPRPGAVTVAANFRHPIDASRRDEYLATYRTRFAAAMARELDEAGRLLGHRFHFLGHQTCHGEHIDWSRDPVSGRDWPRSFSPGIVYRGPGRLGDIKLPWELAKHQYFFTLGKAYWLTGDARYAAEIVAGIERFIADNPAHTGIHWVSALEGGTRPVSWILAFPFFADALDAAQRERLLQSMATHLLFVERMLSTGRFANTHLAGEAAILVLGGLFLDCRHSARWLATGLAHLGAQLDHQLRPDGAHAEQSIAYQRFFLDQYYLVQSFLEANGRSLPTSALQRLETATTCLRDFRTPDGGLLTFGDCDDARSIWCRADAPRDYGALLALGALRFARGDFKAVAGDAPEEILWLGGVDALARYDALPAVLPQTQDATYPDAGYYLARSGWGADASLAAFDCGPLGHGPCGHGHADALSLQLYAAGFSFLADPGTYAYNLDYAWRDRFRLTAAHNTVVVDGADQSVPLDRMSWLRTARARCRHHAASAEFTLVDAEHDGYTRLAAPVIHRRVFARLGGAAWFVVDRLDGAAEHTADTHWHLRPECAATLTDGGAQLRAPNGATLSLTAETSLELAEAWHSDEYGSKQPTRMLVARQRFTGRLEQAWTFALGSTRASAAVRAGFAQFTAADAALNYRMDAGARLDTRGVSFDGQLLALRRGAQGLVEALYAQDCTALRLEGLLSVRSESPLISLALADDELRIHAAPGREREIETEAPGLRVVVAATR